MQVFSVLCILPYFVFCSEQILPYFAFCSKQIRIFVLQITNTSVSMQEKIIILDFGSQTTQLIGRRLRELNVYCEIVPYNKFPYGDESVKGVYPFG